MTKLHLLKNDFNILEDEEKDGYTLRNKSGKITVYNPELQVSLIDKHFQKKYLDLLTSIAYIEDTDEEGASILRDKIRELKENLVREYGKFLPKKTLNKYLKMLLILEEKIPKVKRRIR